MINIEIIPLFSVDVLRIKATNHDKIKKYIMDNVFPHFEKRGPNDPIQNTFSVTGRIFINYMIKTLDPV